MSVHATLEKILACPGVRRCGDGSPETIALALRSEGIALPFAHEAILGKVNGLHAYGDYFRLFGIASPGNDCADLLHWNAPPVWKFAWPEHVLEYLCFGETAWGDQYAYRYDEVGVLPEPPVYFLEAIMLEPEKLAASFEEFLSNEFLRNCRRPKEARTIDARKRIGDLAPRDHVTYIPSPLITGEESLEYVDKMNAIAAMIANGDIASQLGHLSSPRSLEAIEPYEDELGRPRLRAVWSSDSN